MNTPLDSPSPTSTNPRPSAGRRWLRRLRRALLLLAGGAVLLGLVLGFENLRGWRALAAEKARLLAAGRKVRFEDFIPPPVPDDRNFALIPVLRPILDINPDRLATNRWNDPAGWKRAFQMMDFGRIHGNPRTQPAAYADASRGRPTDLRDWQTYFRTPGQPAKADDEFRRRYGLAPVRGAGSASPAGSDPQSPPGYPLPPDPGTPAEDVLRALAVFEPDYAAIHEGLKRPESRYPVRYEDGYETLLPHLAILKRLAQAFSLRASARLEAGDLAGAQSDIEDALAIGESLRTEPFFISQLVRQACVTIAIGPLWEGLTRHRWNESQVVSLQARLERIDLESGFRNNMGLERAGAIRVAERMAGAWSERRRFAEILAQISGGDPQYTRPPELEPFILLAPRGWLYANAVATSRAFEDLESLDPRRIPGLCDAWPAAHTTPSFRLLLHDHYVRGGFVTGFAHSTVRSFAAAFHVRLADTACALERHRLAHGAYPATLEPLAPRLLPALPLDPITGTPLNYRTEAGDRFRVWSVGEDGVDDAGEWPKGEYNEARSQTGDWVWGWPDATVP
jgi:hypothetical protein